MPLLGFYIVRYSEQKTFWKVSTSGLCYCFGCHRGNTNKFDEQANRDNPKLVSYIFFSSAYI